jgi:oxygen-independent coproporphyrinogen-3 oxidase
LSAGLCQRSSPRFISAKPCRPPQFIRVPKLRFAPRQDRRLPDAAHHVFALFDPMCGAAIILFVTSPASTPAQDVSPAAGLYVHVPFCETKCGYCDFYSVALRGRPTRPLVDALCRELALRVPKARHEIRTVFVGGGTPTLLPCEDLTTLLDAIGRCLDESRLTEFTVEANPATVDSEIAALLASRAVSRVSMGAQSFFPDELAALERIHTPADIPASVSVLRDAGIGRINLDLIFGIPGQSLASWRESLHRAIQLDVDHLACYGLTYEPGTALTARRDRGHLTPCDEQLEADMYLLAIDELEAAGYRQYEISNFARVGCESRHNLTYWRNEPYIGIGPSAAGCYHGIRYKNVPDSGQYTRLIDENGSAEVERECLDERKLALEFVLMQLRLNQGLCLDALEKATGLDARCLLAPVIAHLSDRGLLESSTTHVRLTRSGRLAGIDADQWSPDSNVLASAL